MTADKEYRLRAEHEAAHIAMKLKTPAIMAAEDFTIRNFSINGCYEGQAYTTFTWPGQIANILKKGSSNPKSLYDNLSKYTVPLAIDVLIAPYHYFLHMKYKIDTPTFEGDFQQANLIAESANFPGFEASELLAASENRVRIIVSQESYKEFVSFLSNKIFNIKEGILEDLVGKK